jgi:dihydroorotate dehydrogenase electron transfer subunit
MKKRIEDLIIFNSSKLESNYLLLELQSSNKLDEIVPGQFVEILVPGCKDTFLRRPISIHDVDFTKNTIKFLIKIVGCGTETISRMKKGEKLNLVFPLGNGFSLPQVHKVLFIGGGYGIAPFLYFGKILNQHKIKPLILLGARKGSDFVLLDEFKAVGDIYLTTEDGSIGEKGLVTDHSLLNNEIPSFQKIYACGPELMMKAVARYAMKSKIECEVSLDNLMACGIGACLCCVTETIRGNELVCMKGPVFNVNELKWQI